MIDSKIYFKFSHAGHNYIMVQTDKNTVNVQREGCDDIGTLAVSVINDKVQNNDNHDDAYLAGISDLAISQAAASILSNAARGNSEPAEVPTWTARASVFCESGLEENWLVDDIVECNTLGMIFGAPKCGKSFVVLSLAMSIACEQIDTWFGHPVQHGNVFYLAGEGFTGIKKRLIAAADATGLPLTAFDNLIISKRGKKLDADNWSGILDIENELALYEGFKPDLIIIDTLKKSMAGEENSAKDMGLLLDGCRLLMEHYECAVMLIHHAGKGIESRKKSRGSSALDGDVDFSFMCEKTANGVIRFTQELAKDEGELAPMAFKLSPVTLGYNQRGRPVTTAVLMQLEAPEYGPASKFFLNQDQRKACDVLKDVLSKHGLVSKSGILYANLDDFRNEFLNQRRADDRVSHTERSMSKAFYDMLKRLTDQGVVCKEKFNEGKSTRVHFTDAYAEEPSVKAVLQSLKASRPSDEDPTMKMEFQ